MEAFFLGPRTAEISCIAHGFGQGSVRVGVVYVPPFAEEANKARRMASLQARAWAREGVGTLLVDPYGTGDSQGDFGDARWARWIEDVARGVDWCRGRGAEQVWLWGLRTGVLLAADCLKQRIADVDGLVFWQPVNSGALYLRQFLRLRLAADLQGPVKETTRDLQARLEAGEALEVAGYELHPELASELGRQELTALVPADGTPVQWFEVSGGEEPSLSPASERVTEAWRGARVDVQTTAVAGNTFWATQEVTECPTLIEATTDVFRNRQGDEGD